MENLIAQYSSFIFGGLLIIIALAVIGMVIYLACQSSGASDTPGEVITYNQNGYHSSRAGYQTGKYTKNNTYNGRE